MKASFKYAGATAALLSFLFLNCSDNSTSHQPRAITPEPSFDEFNEPLSEITDCTWDSGTGTIKLVLDGSDADENIAVIGLDINDNIKINLEYDCDNTTIAGADVDFIQVNRKAAAPGAVTLIIDYLNGYFSRGVVGVTTSGVSVTTAIDAGSTAFTTGDAVKVRTPDAAVDSIVSGNLAINVDYTEGGSNSADIYFMDAGGVGATIVGIATGSLNDVIDCRGGAGKGGGPSPVPSTVAVTVYGGSGADTIHGGAGADSLFGDEGNDWIDGRLGGDSMSGGDGNDTVSYAAHTAGVTVSIDDSTGDGNGADDGAGDNVKKTVENVIGTTYDDTMSCDDMECDLDGGSGVNTLDFSHETRNLTVTPTTILIEQVDTDTNPDLNVTIDSFNIYKTGDGDDSITGDTDDETFYPGEGDDTIDGEGGTNKVDYSSADGGCVNPCTYVWVNFSTATIEVNGDDLLATNVGLYNGSDALVETDIITDVRFVVGTGGGDTMTAAGQTDNMIFYGKAGDDTLTGGSGHDVLDGGTGTDTLDGGLGANLCFAASGSTISNCL